MDSTDVVKGKVIVVLSHRELPDAIDTAPENAIIEVPSDTILQLGQIAASPNRMNRPDITFRLAAIRHENFNVFD